MNEQDKLDILEVASSFAGFGPLNIQSDVSQDRRRFLKACKRYWDEHIEWLRDATSSAEEGV